MLCKILAKQCHFSGFLWFHLLLQKKIELFDTNSIYNNSENKQQENSQHRFGMQSIGFTCGKFKVLRQ